MFVRACHSISEKRAKAWTSVTTCKKMHIKQNIFFNSAMDGHNSSKNESRISSSLIYHDYMRHGVKIKNNFNLIRHNAYRIHLPVHFDLDRDLLLLSRGDLLREWDFPRELLLSERDLERLRERVYERRRDLEREWRERDRERLLVRERRRERERDLRKK
jgi:hypothetical protein